MLGTGLYVKTRYFSEPKPGEIPDDAHRLDLFVQIHPKGKIYIVSHRSEMGQGISSSLPRVIADEMEAAWEDVEVVQAPGHEIYGDQNTDGSKSVRLNFSRLRKIGATIKTLLENTAAEIWKIPANECKAELSHVYNNNGMRLSFAELAEQASKQPLPSLDNIQLKSRHQFRYIGKKVQTIGLEHIVRGTAKYAWDIQLPNMEYASIERCPVLGGDIKNFNEFEIRELPGVLDVIVINATPLPARFHPLAGIAIIATSTWAAIQARKKLKVEWKFSDTAITHRQHNSDSYLNELKKSLKQESTPIRNRGDVDRALGENQVLEATYGIPYLSHCPMETPCAVAQVSLTAATVWACTQNPQNIRGEVANVLGMISKMVEVNVTLLGGGFGRKSMNDFCVEAALLSKARGGKPVKVCWTREDDIRHDYYHAISTTSFRAALDEENRLLAIDAKANFPSIGSTWDDNSTGPGKGDMSGMSLMPFNIPNIRVSRGKARAHTRIGWLRSVKNIEHGFGIGCFIDEIAREVDKNTHNLWLSLIQKGQYLDFSGEGIDNFEGRDALHDYAYSTDRYRTVIETVANQIDENNLESGQGWGFAAHFSYLSYAAVASKVTLLNDRLTVNKVIIALDCGEIVNPDRVHAQLEGAVVFGLSLALLGEITMINGVTQQSNFHDYPILKINQCPQIETILIPNSNAPSGVGEPGVPPVAPSVCSAIVAAGGHRIRDLPINKEYSV